jgi:hypothetical protein
MENAQERLFRQLLSTHRCSNCRHRFARDRFSVVARHEKLWVVSARCSACHLSQMFWVSLRHGIQRAPDDMTPAEAERLESMPVVTETDVLAMQEFLGSFDGDFRRLFAPTA